MKILIAEDNAPLRRLMRGLLAPLTTEIFECCDGSEALAAYSMHQPDWVLMDILMKDLDGISATREIIAAYPEARVLIVTNYDDTDMREAARRAGASGYVLKENLLEVKHLLTQ